MRYILCLVVGLAVLGMAVTAAQQPRDDQPGRKWSEAELRQASSHVRAGRKLTPRSWPNGARVAVALTFTLNNTAGEIAAGDSAVVQLTGGEFGAAVGLPRVLDVLDRHGVPATFFVAPTAAIIDPQMIPEILKRTRHEIGTLGWSDENPLALSASEEDALLTKSIEYLTKVAGRRPVGARGPSDRVSLNTIRLLKEKGFLYDSTLMAMDEPYELLLSGQPSGLVELPVSRYLDDRTTLSAARFGPSAMPSPELVFEVYRDDFDVAYEEGTLYLLTLHPHLIGMRSRIGYLDELLRYIKSRPNVWFATGAEIARYVRDQNPRPIAAAAEPPAWAYPRVPSDIRVDPDDGRPRTVPGSARTFTLTEIRNFFAPPDWHDDHPPMPGIVGQGRPPTGFACGYCHLPNGIGKPENARVAGLPVAYIKQQIEDFRSGARKNTAAGMLPQIWMTEAARAATDEEIDVAARYFAALPQPKGWTKVVETETVPKTRVLGWILVPDGSNQTEPLGQRIVETAVEPARTSLRDSRSGYVAYVPPGSVKKGEALVTTGGGGKTVQCSTCHGADLKGAGNVPRIAGIAAIYTFRQLFDMQSGARNGKAALLMKPVVAKLGEDDMLSISAYLASLEP